MTDQQPPTPIDAAIDAVEQKRLEEELAMLEPRQPATIPLLSAPHAWDGSQEVTVGAIPDDIPTFLMWDSGQGAFRAVILPAGSTWRVVPDQVTALWTPPGSKR